MRGYLAGLVVLVAAVAAAQEAPKVAIAIIDVQQLVSDSAAGKEMFGRLQKLQDDKVAQGRKMADEIERLQQQLSAQSATLSETKVAELRKQLEDKQIELERYRQDMQQQLEEARRKEYEQLEKQIMPIIDELGREQKLQLIFNKFGSGLLFAEDTLDITEQVLRRFNTKVTK